MQRANRYKVSVIIPAYNRAGQVGRAIQSVLAQTHPAEEIIIVDDGSKDDTRRIVEEIQCGTSVPIHYIYQTQQGVSVARNTGMAAAGGDWIAFLDSDDLWLPDKLEYQVKAIEASAARCGFCFTDAVHVNNALWNWTVFRAVGRTFPKDIGVVENGPEYVVSGNHGIYIQSVMLRRDLLQQVGSFDPSLSIYEDNDFVFRCSLRTELAFVNKPLVEVNRSPDRGEGLMELFAKEDFRLGQIEYEHSKWLKEEIGMTPRLRKLIEARLQGIHAGWASVHLMKDQNLSARRSMQESLSYGVTIRGAIKWVLIRFVPRVTKWIVMKRYEDSVKAMLPGLRT